MTTTAERIAELTAAWEDAVNYGAAPEDIARAGDYSLSEDDWQAGLSEDEAAEIVALIDQQAERRAEAEQIAEDVETSYIPAVEQTEAVRDALIAAALAGMGAA